MYSGAAGQMPSFLEAHRVECPPHYNPADVVIDAVAVRNPQQVEEFFASSSEPTKLGSTGKGDTADLTPLVEGGGGSFFNELFYGYNTSFITQFAVLFHRTTLHTVRSPALFHVHYIVVILLAILLGYVLIYLQFFYWLIYSRCVFYKLPNDLNSGGVQNRFGVLFFAPVMLSFLSAPAIDLFMADRVVYIRESTLVSCESSWESKY